MVGEGADSFNAVDVELVRLVDRRSARSANAVCAEALAQIPQHVCPDLAVIVRLADDQPEKREAEPIAVGLAVDAPDAGRRIGMFGERRIAVDAVGEEIAAALADRIGLDAGELRVQSLTDAVMELVDHDVRVEVAVQIRGAVAVDVLASSSPARPTGTCS